MKHFCYATLIAITFGLVAGTAADPLKPVKDDSKIVIKFPDTPRPAPVPTPPAPPLEPTYEKLKTGQFYVVASLKPLLILEDGTGQVNTTLRKPPFMLPAASAIGWMPTEEDPEFVHWGDEYPYLYVMKALKAGTIKLTVIPATNDLVDGKAVPLTKKDVLYRTLLVDIDAPQPGPTPDPTPDSDPGFGANPFGGQPGLRVMIVFESGTVKDLPLGKFITIHGRKFRDYLDANCVKDGYRMFDPDVQFADDAPLWRDAMKRSDRKTLPWLYVGKEGAGYSGPLGADPEANMAIIAKVAGK